MARLDFCNAFFDAAHLPDILRRLAIHPVLDNVPWVYFWRLFLRIEAVPLPAKYPDIIKFPDPVNLTHVPRQLLHNLIMVVCCRLP